MRCLIVDDHAVVRKGIMEIISDYEEPVHFTESANASDALDALGHGGYDLVLLDINLPDISGMEALRRIRGVFPRLPVLILSIYPEEDFAAQAFKAGASGYLTKSSAPEEMLTAIDRVMSGGRYVGPALAESLDGDPPCGDDGSRQPLSDREHQVVRLLARGEKLGRIADKLGVNVKTVSTYRCRAMRKLGLTNFAQLVRYAMDSGLLDSP